MDRLLPTPASGAMTDEEWGIAIESQFNNTIPATQRKDYLQIWVQQHIGYITFDETNREPGITWIDPDYLEEYVKEESQEAYLALKNRIVYLFEKFYGIVFSYAVEDIDFNTLYSSYLFFVIQSPKNIARFIRSFYENQIQKKPDKSASDFFKEITEPDDKKNPDILYEDSLDTSINYSAVSLVLQTQTMETYIDTIRLVEDGNSLIEFIAEKVLDTSEITFDGETDQFMKRLYEEIQDPSTVEAVLRNLEIV